MNNKLVIIWISQKQQLDIVEVKLKDINEERLQLKMNKSIGIICEEYHTSFTELLLLGVFCFVTGFILSKLDWYLYITATFIIFSLMPASMRSHSCPPQIYCKIVLSLISRISSSPHHLPSGSHFQLMKVSAVFSNFLFFYRLLPPLPKSYSKTFRFSYLFLPFYSRSCPIRYLCDKYVAFCQ